MDFLNITLGVLLAKTYPHKRLHRIEELLFASIDIIKVKSRGKIKSYHPNDFTAQVAYNSGTSQPDRISIIYKDEIIVFTNCRKDLRLYRYSDQERFYEADFNDDGYVFTNGHDTATVLRQQKLLTIFINK